MNMALVIREVESKDYTSVAALWRDVLGLLSVRDETVIKTVRSSRTYYPDSIPAR